MTERPRTITDADRRIALAFLASTIGLFLVGGAVAVLAGPAWAALTVGAVLLTYGVALARSAR